MFFLNITSTMRSLLQISHRTMTQSRESVDLPLTCQPSPRRTSFAFRLSEVRRLLLDLDPCGGSEPLGMFPLFLKRTADVLRCSVLSPSS